MSTSTEENLRNGTLAIKLAEKACKLENWHNPESLDALACSYAEIGDFDSAVKYEEKAIALLQKNVRADFIERLDLFNQKKPYRK
ncbi:MAG TPA: hypothetical protein PLP05_11075 [Sedimentisphaerales bacterium]|nr:hypothetical protein [Sedimentisphaerales bacterium]